VAIILFKCPFCGKKVETPEDNVGREGLCPGCHKIFEIPKPTQAEASRAPRGGQDTSWLSAGPPEYQEMPVLIGVGALALGLAALGATTFLTWLRPGVEQQAFVSVEKTYILLGSALCLAFILLSAVTRRSLMPCALTGAGWGMFALIWIGGIWRTMVEVAEGSGGTGSLVASGMYLAMGACLLAIAGAVFVWYQVRDGMILSRFGFFFLVVQVAALFGALMVVGRHVKPHLLGPEVAAEASSDVEPGIHHPFSA